MKSFTSYVACYGETDEYPWCGRCRLQEGCWRKATKKIAAEIDRIIKSGHVGNGGERCEHYFFK